MSVYQQLFDQYQKQLTQKNILVLFDGYGCVSQMAKKLGYNVKTLDILNLDHIDLAMDILDFKPSYLNDFIPDEVWASPPCETWSIVTAMKGGGNRYWESIKLNGKVVDIKPRSNFSIDKRLTYPDRITEKRIIHTKLVDKTIEIIDYYKSINPNLIYYIENPATGYIRYYLNKINPELIENKTTYCKYGSPYRKETSIFSNVKLNLHWCPKKTNSNGNTCHHSDSFQLRYDHKKQPKEMIIPKTYLERSHIPDLLCYDILSQIKHNTISVLQ